MSLGPDGSTPDVCSYLGLKDDVGSHALYPRMDHICVLAPGEKLPASRQRQQCLCPKHRLCARYRVEQPHGLLKPLVVSPPPRRRPRAGVILMTVLVMIWLTAAASAALYFINTDAAASSAVQFKTSLAAPRIGPEVRLFDVATAR